MYRTRATPRQFPKVREIERDEFIWDEMTQQIEEERFIRHREPHCGTEINK